VMFGGKQVVVCGYGEVNSWAHISVLLEGFRETWDGDSLGTLMNVFPCCA
jgi:hypothetical protein